MGRFLILLCVIMTNVLKQVLSSQTLSLLSCHQKLEVIWRQR